MVMPDERAKAMNASWSPKATYGLDVVCCAPDAGADLEVVGGVAPLLCLIPGVRGALDAFVGTGLVFCLLLVRGILQQSQIVDQMEQE